MTAAHPIRRSGRELLSHEGADQSRELVVVTASWSDAPRPAPRTAEVAGALPAAAFWTSVLTDDSMPGEETWTHLWASAARLHGEELPRLLRLVADYATGGVIITTAEMGWLTTPMTAAPTLSPRARSTGTSSAARTRTGCPLTARDCDTQRRRVARWATSCPGASAHPPTDPA
jgi:hypothetical protein